MNGTFLALEIGTVAIAVGVPTAPISAKMLSSSISFVVWTTERSGSYPHGCHRADQAGEETTKRAV
jgi:hypothetical protein